MWTKTKGTELGTDMNPEMPKTSSARETENETEAKSKIGRGKKAFRELDVINDIERKRK